jgi:hypothetical protein
MDYWRSCEAFILPEKYPQTKGCGFSPLKVTTVESGIIWLVEGKGIVIAKRTQDGKNTEVALFKT